MRNSSPCLPSVPQSFSPYFSWLYSCTKTQWVWAGLQVGGRKSLLSAAAGTLEEHTGEMTDELPSSSFLQQQTEFYLPAFVFLYPPLLLLSWVQLLLSGVCSCISPVALSISSSYLAKIPPTSFALTSWNSTTNFMSYDHIHSYILMHVEVGSE